MANDLTTSTWTPPESKGVQQFIKYGTMAAVVAGGVYAFTAFAPTMVDAVTLANTLLQDATHMIVSGVVLIGTAMLAHSLLSSTGSLNKLLQLPYWMLINGLTRFFITINPLSPIDQRLKSVEADKEDFENQFEKFDGIIRQIADKEQKSRAASDDYGKKAIASKERGITSSYDLCVNASRQYAGAADRYSAMRQRLEPARATVKSIAQACDVTIQKLKIERNILSDMWGVQQSVDGVVKSGSRILGRSKSDLWNMAEQAENVIDSKYSDELGHLDHLKDYADPFIQSIDLDNATYSDDLLKKMQSSGSKLIQSTQATPMPSLAAPSAFGVPVNAPSSETLSGLIS